MVGNVSSVPAWVCHSWVVGLPDIARQTDRKGCLRGHPLVPKLWLLTLHCLFWKTCVDSTLHFNACENQAKDAQGSPASCCLTAPEPPSPLHPPPDLPNRDPKPESKVCHPVSSQDPRPSSPTTPLHSIPIPRRKELMEKLRPGVSQRVLPPVRAHVLECRLAHPSIRAGAEV